VTYALALAAHQSALVRLADAVVVPSAAGLERLRELRAPLPERVHVVPHVVRRFAAGPRVGGTYALVASRLAPEKAVDVAIEACRRAGLALRIAGDGPERSALEARARGADVTFLGRIPDLELARERAGAAVALAPTRAAETFGLAAVEAMAAGLPTWPPGSGPTGTSPREPSWSAATIPTRWPPRPARRGGSGPRDSARSPPPGPSRPPTPWRRGSRRCTPPRAADEPDLEPWPAGYAPARYEGTCHRRRRLHRLEPRRRAARAR
jgi:hypothetical protein